MALIKKSFRRTSGFRDAKLIVIATEGERTEPAYFRGLKAAFRKPAIHMEILPRTTAGSSPAHVQEELDKFNKVYNLVEGDELWMVIDRDQWPDKNLAETAGECERKGYFLAVSTPCFELWLLLQKTPS
jgi:hypothetical protein